LVMKTPMIISYAIDKVILSLSEKLVAATTQGFQYNFQDLLEVTVAMGDIPFIFNNFSSQAFSLNFGITNLQTKETAPITSVDILPYSHGNSLPIQLFLGENFIAQALWGVFQVKKAFSFSGATLPPTAPPILNTSNINTLFPDISEYFEMNKGIYLEVQKGGEYPLVFIRDGRLLIELSVEAAFHVDPDSSQYPQQGLANCTQCQEAIALNATVFASLDLYPINATAIGLDILDIELIQLEYLDGVIGVPNLQNLKIALNNMIDAMILSINYKYGEIELSNFKLVEKLLEKAHVNEVSIGVGTSYLFVGLSLG